MVYNYIINAAQTKEIQMNRRMNNVDAKNLPKSIKLLIKGIRLGPNTGVKPRSVKLEYGKCAVNTKAFSFCAISPMGKMVDADDKGSYSYMNDGGEPNYVHMETSDKPFVCAWGYHKTKDVTVYVPCSEQLCAQLDERRQARKDAGGEDTLTAEEIAVLVDSAV